MAQRVPQGLNKSPLTEPCYTERQRFVGHVRGCAIGFENPVPHREAEAEIGAAFMGGSRMMEAVHVW